MSTNETLDTIESQATSEGRITENNIHLVVDLVHYVRELEALVASVPSVLELNEDQKAR